MNQIKNLSILFTFFFCVLLSASCGDDDDTSPNDDALPSEAVTAYTGALTYTSASGDIIINPNGTATIDLDGNEYDIDFSDDVPSLTGVIFVESNGSYAASDSGNITGITVDGDELSIGSTSGGATWAFDGSR